MKKIIGGLFVLAMLISGTVSAQQVIAFVDVDVAILSSEPAKDKVNELTARLAPEKNKVKELENTVRGLQVKLQQDAAVMNETEKRNLANEIEIKAVEYQQRVSQLQESQENSRQELMQGLAPKFQAALAQLMKEGGYTVLMHRKAVLVFDPKDDLTKKVTEVLNSNP